VRYEGTYDFETCRAKPTRVARVRAPALLPGLAYGFRTCVPVCNAIPDKPGSAEELLVIIGPPAKWVGASVPWPKMQTEPHVGFFTRLIVPLKRGGSASTFMHVSNTDMAAFTARRRTKSPNPLDLPKAPLLQLSFDFSWPEGDAMQLGVGLIGTVSSDGAINDQENYRYEFSEGPVDEEIVVGAAD